MSEKKVESRGTVPEKKIEKKWGGDVFPFVIMIIVCLLALVMISVFLNNQKLHKQIVDLDRKVVILQEGDQELGNRVLALEDELVVLSLKERLLKIKNSLKSLLDLQGLMADNQELVATVQGLVDDLGGEAKKLEQEIAGTTPKVFQASRPCPEPVVIMHPSIPQKNATPLESAHAPAPAAIPVAILVDGKKPETWWSKFINLRLFGD